MENICYTLECLEESIFGCDVLDCDDIELVKIRLHRWGGFDLLDTGLSTNCGSNAKACFESVNDAEITKATSTARYLLLLAALRGHDKGRS